MSSVADLIDERFATDAISRIWLPHIGSMRYACDGPPANEVGATYFSTDPAKLIAERGNSASLMMPQPSASGARYQDGIDWRRERQGEAIKVRGDKMPEMRCQPLR